MFTIFTLQIEKVKSPRPFASAVLIEMFTYRKNIDVQDDEMECERKSHGCDEPHVGPRRHGDERLILRQAIEKYRFYYNPETAILM